MMACFGVLFSVRQVLLHILPGDPGYGALYTPAETADWARGSASGSILAALEETVARLTRAGGRVAP